MIFANRPARPLMNKRLTLQKNKIELGSGDLETTTTTTTMTTTTTCGKLPFLKAIYAFIIHQNCHSKLD